MALLLFAAGDWGAMALQKSEERDGCRLLCEGRHQVFAADRLEKFHLGYISVEEE